MNNKEKFLEVGMATVTPNGLYFLNHYYSSPSMLKDQWFAEAQKNGDWKVPVFFKKNDPRILMIMNFTFTDFAFVLDSPQKIDEDLTSAYYLAFNNLKKQLKHLDPPQ